MSGFGPTGYLMANTSCHDKRSERPHHRENRLHVSLLVLNTRPSTLRMGTQRLRGDHQIQDDREGYKGTLSCPYSDDISQGVTTPSTYKRRLNKKGDIFDIQVPLEDTHRDMVNSIPTGPVTLNKENEKFDPKRVKT